MTRIRFLTRAVYSAMMVPLAGCTKPAPPAQPTDAGPTYIAPTGTGPTTIAGIRYGYVATPDRERQITSGFSRLKANLSRVEVREALGSPDVARPIYARADSAFRGWGYTYRIKMRSDGPNTNDVCVEVFFDVNGKLRRAVPSHIEGLSEVGGYGDGPAQ